MANTGQMPGQLLPKGDYSAFLPAPLRLLEMLADNPFVTVNGVAEKLELAFTTAQRAIRRLEQIGVLKQKGEAQRGRVFCAQSILDVLEEPARLNRWEATPAPSAG